MPSALCAGAYHLYLEMLDDYIESLHKCVDNLVVVLQLQLEYLASRYYRLASQAKR